MRLALIGALALTLCGCGGSAQQPSVNVRALARGAVETLASAWVDSAQGCLSVAEASSDPQATAKTCEGILDPIRGTLIAAGDAVNTWAAADQQSFPCLLQQFVKDFEDAEVALTAMNVPLPSGEINDGLALAQVFLPQCSADGGK